LNSVCWFYFNNSRINYCYETSTTGTKNSYWRYFIAKQIITNEQLSIALNEQKNIVMRLAKTLIALNFLGEKTLLAILYEQLDMPFVDLKNFNYKRSGVLSLKETIARRYRVAVLKPNDNNLTLGMSEPTDIFCLN
jgi:MSHA biogenesis protein MshE